MSQVAQSSQIDGRAPEQPHALDLASRIEALLFVADQPVAVNQLAQVLNVPRGDVEAALRELAAHYAPRGLRLQQRDGLVQLVTAPEAAPYVERFLGLESSTRLSAAALETLALVAYRQPVTRPQIEAVRGVNCDGVLRTLLSHGLIAPAGRLEQAGRPILYATTFEFLQHFGLSDLSELPPLEQFALSQGGGERHEPRRPKDETPTGEEV